MAKYSSNLADPSGSYKVAAPSTPKVSTGTANAVATLAGLGEAAIKSFATTALEEKKKTEAEVKAAKLSELQTNMLSFEDEERIVNSYFAEMRSQMPDADAQKMTQLQNEYNKLYQMETVGASSSSIAARRNAYLKRFIAENPHLTAEAMDITGKTDQLVGIGLKPSEDPVVKAREETINESLKTGVPVKALIKNAQIAQQLQMEENEAKLAAASRELNFDDMYQHSSTIGMGLELQIASELDAQLRNNPEGIDGPALYAQLQRVHGQRVDFAINNMIGLAKEGGLTLGREEINNLRTQLQGQGMESYKVLIEESDKTKLVEKARKLAEDEAKLRATMTKESFFKQNPYMRNLSAIYGESNTLRLAAHIQDGITRTSSGNNNQVKLHQQQLQTNSEYRIAWDYYRNNAPQVVMQRLDNGGQTTGDPMSDMWADNATLKAFQAGDLNTSGTQSMLNNILVNGFSTNNRRELLSDRTVAAFKKSEEAQKALNNFTANTFTAELSNKLPQIEEDGYIIKYNPNAGGRVKEGNNYHPAEVFTIKAEDGSTVDKDWREYIHKINTLYTLSSEIKGAEEMAALGKAMTERLDRDNPEFIKNSAKSAIEGLSKQRDKIANFYKRRLESAMDPSIYSSPEQQATYRENQMMELAVRMRKFDEMIGDQRIRLGEIAEGSFQKLTENPSGLTNADVNMAESTNAVQQGKPLKSEGKPKRVRWEDL